MNSNFNHHDLLKELIKLRNDNSYLIKQLEIILEEIDNKDLYLLDKDFGVIELLKRIINLNKNLNDFNEINNQNSSLILSLCRMIIDTFGIINLLINHGCKQEQEFRYLLYLKNGFDNKLKITKNFSDHSKISQNNEELNHTIQQYYQHLDLVNSKLEVYKKSVHNLIIEKSIWNFKYISQTNKSFYNWSQLHHIAGIHNKYLKIFQDNYSEHVHGLAGIIIKNDLSIAKISPIYNTEITLKIIQMTIRNYTNHISLDSLDFGIRILVDPTLNINQI
ncbi:hypothetical protein [Empedobacter tilapiae]|uniref:hypothetical protein n=1 Tax=Empedobacter tilapiae TaxID=2491114 RepID=UPI0028CFED50|nr:hypothetical protein [Empedobacter tilapiae]